MEFLPGLWEDAEGNAGGFKVEWPPGQFQGSWIPTSSRPVPDPSLPPVGLPARLPAPLALAAVLAPQAPAPIKPHLPCQVEAHTPRSLSHANLPSQKLTQIALAGPICPLPGEYLLCYLLTISVLCLILFSNYPNSISHFIAVA